MVNKLRLVTCLATLAVPLLLLVTLLPRGKARLPWDGSLTAAGLPQPEPTVVVEQRRHDFGRVSAGALLMAGFQVRNAGQRRLVLRQQARSCECIAAPQTEIVIPPGGQRNLAPTLDTAKISGMLQAEVVYRTNDPKQPTVKFVLLADVTPSPTHSVPEQSLEPIPMDGNL